MAPFASLARQVLDLAFPPRCAGCGGAHELLCPSCLATLAARLEAPPGIPIGLPIGIPAPLLQLEWVAPYAGVARRVILVLKYRGERRLAPLLGSLLAARWRRAGIGGNLLVPVPVHPQRRAMRGFDQAQLIATEMGLALGLPVVPALQRRRETRPQYGLGRTERLANVAGAFAVSPSWRSKIAGRWVVLVDDVFTTGATMAACAHPLLGAGAAAVSAITVAREG